MQINLSGVNIAGDNLEMRQMRRKRILQFIVFCNGVWAQCDVDVQAAEAMRDARCQGDVHRGFP